MHTQQSDIHCLDNVTTYRSVYECARPCVTHQNGEFAAQQLGAEGLLIGVDVDDAFLDSCVLTMKRGSRVRS